MSGDTAVSRNGVSIRLPDERWQHIIEEHAELAELREEVLQSIQDADRVLAGSAGELLAVREFETGKAIVVVYREVDPSDGFVITAFLTRRLKSLNNRVQLWPLPT
jgi:hypothetical protein